ncbi:MAG: fructose-6-phosphate aldolase [Truepera sp.]|nr:fructose-6-phosphate aldolase [Truepera sp.]
MELYLDTADVAEIRELAAWGVLGGVTTNPSLMAKAGRSPREVIAEITALVPGPISAEVISTETAGMIAEGRALAAIAENVVVKVPLIPAGLAACRALSDQGIKVNVTLCFSVNQAILAAAAGAWCVSPFLGRLDDINQDGMQLLREIVEVYRTQGYQTRVLAASIRNPLHVTQAALAGADMVTMPAAVMRQLVKHPLTEAGLQKFLADYRQMAEATA